MTKLVHLQGIRGIAIVSVVLFHFFPDYFPNGYLGVDLYSFLCLRHFKIFRFFVLSGYLMSMMLFRHSSLDFPIILEFLFRRVKRIVPLYYLVAIVTSKIITNLVSAERAIWLTTNLHWDGAAGYFEKLDVAHDLFTHTWSLCLEMQFYLLFPFLWWIQLRLSLNRRMVLLHLLSGGSLYFYLVSGEKRAFNNMFCRVWQFLFGNMVFCLQQQSQDSVSEKQPLLEEESVEKPESSSWIFASLSLLLLGYSTVTEQHLTQDYSRMTTTIVSIMLIYFGQGFSVLENRLLVFLGEVSYSWYLVHWPLLTAQKIVGLTSLPLMASGILVSFTIAVVLHYGVEKFYLGWSKMTISLVVAGLFLGSLGVHFALVHSRFNACIVSPILRTDYSQMSIWQKKMYNAELIEHDQYQLLDKGCVFDPPKTDLNLEGTCRYENAKSNNSRTIAIVGNSWAANSAPIVFEECSPYFGNIHRAAAVGCEVLKTTAPDTCLPREKTYFDLVEKVKPDYLFIITRYCFMGVKQKDEDWPGIVKEGIQRLYRLSEHVKEKIFIIHTFPAARVVMEQLNDRMEKGTPIDWQWEPDSVDIPKAQEKLDEIVNQCPKCQQFDYTPQFVLNGTFYPYDPLNNIAYLTYGFHLTLPALERVRPVFTEICNKIGKQ